VFQTDVEHQRRLEERCAELDKARTEQQKKDREQPLAVQHGPKQKLFEKFEAEWKAYIASWNLEDSKDAAGVVGAKYGSPLSSGNVARLAYWPARKARWPLLYYCACVYLAGKKASSTSNERTHSVVSRIMSRFRSCMKATTLQELTLAHTYARQAAMELIKELKAESIDIGELEAQLDDLFGELTDPVLPAVAEEIEWCVQSPPSVPAGLYHYITPSPPLTYPAEAGYIIISKGRRHVGGQSNCVISYIKAHEGAHFNF
jgi:hypothetical protein